jgi:hypothetical protein
MTMMTARRTMSSEWKFQTSMKAGGSLNEYRVEKEIQDKRLLASSEYNPTTVRMVARCNPWWVVGPM